MKNRRLAISVALVLALHVSGCARSAVKEVAAANVDSPDGEDPAYTNAEVSAEAKAYNPDAIANTPILPALSINGDAGALRLNYAATTPAYEVTGSIDKKIDAFDPVIAAQFAQNISATGSHFAADAVLMKAEADAAKAKGEEYWWPGAYTFDLNYKPTLILDDMISIEETSALYTGGAHGMYTLGGLVFRKGGDVPLGLEEIVTDEAAFEALMFEALVDAKIARGYEAPRETILGEARDFLADSDAWKSNFVLEPSNVTGKIGGVTVLFSPYDVGSYAEGAYAATIPAEKLAPILNAAMKPRFGGTPVVKDRD